MRTGALRSTIPSPMATFAMLVLSAACLYWAKPVLVPTALAILFAILLTPVVVWLQHRGLNRAIAVGATVAVAGAATVALGWIIATQLVGLAERLPTYQSNITHKIAAVRARSNSALLKRWEVFVREISAEATRETPVDGQSSETMMAEAEAQAPMPVRIVNDSWEWDNLPNAALLGALFEPIAIGGLVLVLVIYLLFNREDVRNRLLCLLGDGHMTRTTRAIDDAGRRISRFLLMQFVLNATFGLFVGTFLYFVGLPYAIFWGIWGAFMRYIPLIGPWILAAFPMTLSLLTAEGWTQPLMIAAMFIVAELAVNLVIEPWLYGQSIGVSQGALLLAIAFWTWLWGIPGLMLAAPLTVCLAVMGKHVPGLRILDIILGDEPTMTPQMQFYQRLLAHDLDEASALMKSQLRTLSPVEAYDQLCISALISASADEESARIAPEDQLLIAEMIRDVAEENAPSLTTSTKDDEASEEGDAGGRANSQMMVLFCPARNRSDEIALELFQSLLDPRQYEFEVLSRAPMVAQIVEQAELVNADVICLAALPVDGLAHARLLCKRLRMRLPNTKLFVARWGMMRDDQELAEENASSCGADYFSTSMAETHAQLLQMSNLYTSQAVAVAPNP